MAWILKQFTKLPDYLKQASLETNKDFVKVAFAEKIIPHLKRNDLAGVLDLSEKLDAICKSIGEWNGKSITIPIA